MGLGIRTKLVISFIVVIFIPLLFTVFLSTKTVIEIQKDPVMKVFWERQMVQETLVESIKTNFPYISYHNEFYDRINPELERYKINLKIISPKGVMMFDSKNKHSFGQYYFTNKDNFFQRQFQIGFKTEAPIYIGNKLAATAIFEIDRNKKIVLETISKYFLKGFGLGLLSLIGMIIVFTWYISKSILKPLKELNNATKNISQGNLDFQIKYKGNDELGRFCSTFDLMRMKLKESLEAQSRAEISRKEMMASISHDFKTPIASIKGYVEGIQDGVADDKETFDRYLTVIKNKADRLDHLIDEFFSATQMELNKLNINFTMVDSQKIFEDIFKDIELDTTNSNINFSIKRPIPSRLIKLDKYRIEQVIDNLVENAKRYTEEEALIYAQVIVNEDELTVMIGDNGIGIDKRDLPHIFESFYRGEKSRSSKYGGAGLGLSICKYIIEAHGGRIWVESEKNIGSIVYFTLPIYQEL